MRAGFRKIRTPSLQEFVIAPWRLLYKPIPPYTHPIRKRVLISWSGVSQWEHARARRLVGIRNRWIMEVKIDEICDYLGELGKHL